ncbi:AC76 family protein [Streptococcus constellatus]|uniref:AC76 family protein n=1 Tax=Streptococcus constellatus TaxID=76860 RepID=UPI002001AEC5|nr:AC76 family protein [Streptococcus constellatus]
MTLKDRVENLEALHTVQKRNLANTQLWLMFVSFIVFLLVIGMIAGYGKQQTQIKDLQTELERVTDEQKHVNQRQDVMINKFNQMYYEYQHKKITGKDNFPGG